MRILTLHVENYRTLEDVSISFSEGYNAICGKNNSGKSNLIRAMRLLFGEKSERFPFEEGIEFSYKSDLCAWKKSNKSANVRITGKVKVSRETDQGIVEFIESIDEDKTKLEKGKPHIDITVSMEASTKSTSLETATVHIEGAQVTDPVVSRGIHDKIKSGVIFHNSTMSSRVYFSRHRRLHGFFSKIPEVTKSKVDKKSLALKTEINKVFKDHAKELQSMLGRLGDRLEVKLDTPEFDFTDYPYGISLGYKDFNIPLDDWGSGTRNQTLIVKSIFDAKASHKAVAISDRISPVVLVEEPESFLHPLAQAEFSEVLQGLANEWSIQVVATTHSPYLLSHRNSNANILLERQENKGIHKLGPTTVVGVGGSDWKKPFEHALGICGPEFEIFKAAIFSNSSILVLVEGETDREYLELCKQPQHGSKALLKEAEIFSYDGKDKIKSDVLLKFIRDRFAKVIITSDLDAEDDLKNKLKSLGFEKDKNYFLLGIDKPGKRAIEGLIPDQIRKKVQTDCTDLIDALSSDNKDEVRAARASLKKKYLDAFRTSAKVENGDFNQFHELCKKINTACET